MRKGQTGYNWKFFTVGKATRVSITTGEDIAHLKELDQKLWTVLSCPVKGLEFDENTLTMMDTNHDGKIHANEVMEAANWLTSVLKNPDILIHPEEEFPLSELNTENEDGLKLYNSAKQILANLELDKETISIADTSDSIAIFEKTRFNGDGIITLKTTDDEKLQGIIKHCMETIGTCKDRSGEEGINAEQLEQFYTACREYDEWQASAQADREHIFPYGEHTEEALSACNTLKNKIADYFMRCKLSAFNNECAPTLDISAERIGDISQKDLSACAEEIAAYPLARVSNKCLLPLNGGINPAWQSDFNNLKTLVFDNDFPNQESISESEWNNILEKFSAFNAWKEQEKGNIVESIGAAEIHDIVNSNREQEIVKLIEEDKKLEEEANAIDSVNRLVHLYRDFYTLLRNFITFSDFYIKDENRKAIFQAGTLYIDQRSCDLCIKVSDMSKQNTMAGLSGMFILYCNCVSKVKNETMTIAAVVTDGDINDLREGKNGIFYDRNGLDWDATVTKIIDNPISVRQAFWSPYRKLARFVEDQVNKMASDKDAKSNELLTSKTTESANNLATADPKAQQKKQAFDIAKFCGIFAAIGMALGYIGSFLVSCFTGFVALKWWQMIVALAAIILIISGPAMILAWLKLRKRDLSPILNANDWAINSHAIVNIKFGATLTHLAKYPKANIKLPKKL